MTVESSPCAAKPAFKNCVRCGYSLRGLPVGHACPECGLRYDENSGLYRPQNPKAVLALWLCIFGGGWINIKGLPKLFSLSTATLWETIYALCALIWLIGMIAMIVVLYRFYKRGQFVAVTADGLIIQMVAFNRDLIPWSNIGDVKAKEVREGKPQIASVYFKDKQKYVDVGAVGNVFPTRSKIEQFVDQVKRHIDQAPQAPAFDQS